MSTSVTQTRREEGWQRYRGGEDRKVTKAEGAMEREKDKGGTTDPVARVRLGREVGETRSGPGDRDLPPLREDRGLTDRTRRFVD